MCSAFTPMDQQAINVQQQMYPQLVPSVADISAGPMHYPYSPAEYSLTSNVNYLSSNHLMNPGYHHHYHMSQQSGYGLAASPTYSYASSAQSASSYSSCSPRSSDSVYGLSPAQQQQQQPHSPVQTPSPPPAAGASQHASSSSSLAGQLQAAWSGEWPLECPPASGVASAPKWLVELPRPERRRVARCGCPYCATGREVKNEKGQRVHVCSIAGCEKSYHKTSHLKAHIRTHMGVRPYPCTWDACRRRFSRSDELNRHMRIHLQRKTHVCQLCGKGFTRSDHLQKHRKTHENQKRRKPKKETAHPDETPAAAAAAAAATATTAKSPAPEEITQSVAPTAIETQPRAFTTSLQQPQLTQQLSQQQYQQGRQPILTVQHTPQHEHYAQQPVMQLQFTCVTHPNNFYHY